MQLASASFESNPDLQKAYIVLDRAEKVLANLDEAEEDISILTKRVNALRACIAANPVKKGPLYFGVDLLCPLIIQDIHRLKTGKTYDEKVVDSFTLFEISLINPCHEFFQNEIREGRPLSTIANECQKIFEENRRLFYALKGKIDRSIHQYQTNENASSIMRQKIQLKHVREDEMSIEILLKLNQRKRDLMELISIHESTRLEIENTLRDVLLILLGEEQK